MSREHETLNDLFNDIARAIAQKNGKVNELNTYLYNIPNLVTRGKIGSFGGKSVVKNQLVDKSKFVFTTAITYYGITYINNGDGTFTVSGTSTARSNPGLFTTANRITLIQNHKYLFKGSPSGGSSQSYYLSAVYYSDTGAYKGVASDFGSGIIFTPPTDAVNCNIELIGANVADLTVYNLVFRPQLIDLTKKFGAGNEPTTVEEVEAIIGTDYIPYNTGEIKNAVVDSVDSVGFNIFDKDTVKTSAGNRIKNDSGTEIVDGNSSYYVEYIHVLPDTKYYRNANIDNGLQRIYFYDFNKNWISRTETFGLSNDLFTTPSNCYYIQLQYDHVNHPLIPDKWCINVSQPDTTKSPHNGDYLPYNTDSKTIPSAVKVLPLYGASAGDVYNEIDWVNKKYIQRVGSYTFTGEENWTKSVQAYYISFSGVKVIDQNITASAICSRLDVYSANYINAHANISGFAFGFSRLFLGDLSYADKASLTGETIYYELATPIETDISSLLTDDEWIQVEGGGTLTFTQSDLHIPVPSKVWTNNGEPTLNQYVADDFPDLIRAIPQ